MGAEGALQNLMSLASYSNWYSALERPALRGRERWGSGWWRCCLKIVVGFDGGRCHIATRLFNANSVKLGISL